MRFFFGKKPAPTVFHITHWKAGSQWLHRILCELVPDRIVSPKIDEVQFLSEPLVRGAVYPTVYVTREQFYSISLPKGFKKFVILRDLRDTLVSGYFSLRYSHPINDERLERWRRYLESASVEDGLLMLIDEWLPASARVQQSWVNSGEKFIRYEELLSQDCELLEEVLIGECKLAVSSDRLREVVLQNRFESLTKGRNRGEENILSHERKGVSGDWENHFSEPVAKKFNDRYGALLVASGYKV